MKIDALRQPFRLQCVGKIEGNRQQRNFRIKKAIATTEANNEQENLINSKRQAEEELYHLQKELKRE